MDLQTMTYIVVGATFALYIGIAIWSKASSTGEFYVAGKGVHPVANGMATAADWMSAASFISMAGLIAFLGYDASVYLMGWTGGYVLLALLLAPYLRKFGKFTVPEFIGDRFYSKAARLVAVICLITMSITYVIGQMRGVGVAFGRFLEVPFQVGVYVGMGIVFIYAVLGGMKGITYTQIAQYCVLILAYTIPAIFISLQLTGSLVGHCFEKDEAYFAFLGLLFKDQRKWALSENPVEELAKMAKLGGIDQDRFNACLQDEERLDAILGGIKHAQDTYGVKSTPSFVIDETLYPGNRSFEDFDRLLEGLAT